MTRAAIIVAMLVTLALVAATPALGAADLLLNGAATVSSRSSTFATCSSADYLLAYDGNDATKLTGCTATGNDSFATSFTSTQRVRALHLKYTLGGLPTGHTEIVIVEDDHGRCLWQNIVTSGVCPGGTPYNVADTNGTWDITADVTTSPSTAAGAVLSLSMTFFATGTCSGGCVDDIYTFSAYASAPDHAGPSFASVYVCEDGTVTCDGTVPARWSQPTHSFELAVNLADTGNPNPCTLRISDLEGANYDDLGTLGPYSLVIGTQQHVGPLWDSTSHLVTNATPLRVTCRDETDAAKVATWVFTLNYDGTVSGASNRAIAVVPGRTFDPHNDVSDTPLSAIYNAWSDLIGAYQQRAPFVFIDPAVRAVTGTIANVRAAMLPAASGHYGPTTCPGYTFALTSDVFPAIRYPTKTPNAANTATPIPSATGGGWPSGNPLPSFTVLQCQDFAAVTSITWWHQVRGLMDYGLLVSYGLIWLRRLQPRFQAAS